MGRHGVKRRTDPSGRMREQRPDEPDVVAPGSTIEKGWLASRHRQQRRVDARNRSEAVPWHAPEDPELPPRCPAKGEEVRLCRCRAFARDLPLHDQIAAQEQSGVVIEQVA
jgi:hypothetical protein